MQKHYLNEIQKYLPSKEEPFGVDESLDLDGLQFLINRIPCKTGTEKQLLDMLYQVCGVYQEQQRLLREGFEKSWQEGSNYE